jgi:hypothetical protein
MCVGFFALLPTSDNILIIPNPVCDLTTINFSLQNEKRLKVSIYSLNGELVTVVADRVFSSGKHNLLWNRIADGKTAKQGIYFLNIEF